MSQDSEIDQEKSPKSQLRDSSQLQRIHLELEAQLDVCKKARKKASKLKDVAGFDAAVANTTATLSRAMSNLNMEMRRQEAHEMEIILTQFTAEQQDGIVLEYIREASPERQRTFLEEVRKICDESALLGEG